jgi:hypothetical protein
MSKNVKTYQVDIAQSKVNKTARMQILHEDGVFSVDSADGVGECGHLLSNVDCVLERITGKYR